MNPNVNNGPELIITYWSNFISCNKYSTLITDVGGRGHVCLCEYRECICTPHRIVHCPCQRLLNNIAECNSNFAWGVGGTSTLCMISEEYGGLIRNKTQLLSQLRNNGDSNFPGHYSYFLNLQNDSQQ